MLFREIGATAVSCVRAFQPPLLLNGPLSSRDVERLSAMSLSLCACSKGKADVF